MSFEEFFENSWVKQGISSYVLEEDMTDLQSILKTAKTEKKKSSPNKLDLNE